MRYFAYGSNLCVEKLRGIAQSAEPTVVARLVGFKLVFHKRSTDDGSGKADALRTGNEKDCVWGVIYEIADKEENALDNSEGGYNKVEVTVYNEAGKAHTAKSYFAKRKRIDNRLRPFTWYLRFVKEGAYYHKLPQQYIQECIENVEAIDDLKVERDKARRSIKCSESSSWTTKRLGDIAKIDKLSVQPDEIRRGTIFVGLENINESGAIEAARTVFNGELLSTKFRFTNNHILYGKLRPYLRKIARPAFDGVCSTDILPILPGNDSNRDYLYFYLRRPELIKLATERSIGANLPRLSPSTLAEFDVSLPPLPIQKQIAAILEKADAAREKRRQANQLTEQFLQSAFLEMFGDPVTNPKGWERKRLGDIITKITNGYVGPTRDIYRETGVPYILSKHIKRNRILFDSKTFISDEFNLKNKKSILRQGDVLLVQTGDIGQAAVVPKEHAGHNCHALIVMSPVANVLNGTYLSRYLTSDAGIRQTETIETGATLRHLNCHDVKELKIPVPPISEQQKFAALVEKVEGLRVKQVESGRELENLFQSLMQRAFKGELVG